MRVADVDAIVAGLESFLGGVPRFVPTRRGAPQWIGPNGNVVRFDLQPGQHGRGGPHINLETANTPRASPSYVNLHAFVR